MPLDDGDPVAFRRGDGRRRRSPRSPAPPRRIGTGLAALRRTGVPYHTVFGQTPDAEYQQWRAGVLPDAVSTVLPGSGHFPHLAHPTRFARVLAATARWAE